VPELLSNNLAYGRFVFFRILYACGALADPFYILYATRELGASAHIAAAYLVTLVIARAGATLGWRAVSIGSGNPMVLQLATFVRLLAPITALTLPPLLGSATLRDRLPGGDTTNLIAFGLVFAAWGAASAGLDLAAPAIQSALTTPRERGAAHFVTGVALAITTLALPLGGLIADRLGFSFLFIAALVLGLGTLLAGGLIDEPGVFVLRPAPNERPVLRRRSARREG
jgi:MFS family permease